MIWISFNTLQSLDMNISEQIAKETLSDSPIDIE
jgi:hypothetical protein